MIKGAIFDMDGLMIDTEKLYNRFWCKAANDFGYDMKFEDALKIRSLAAEYAIPKLEKRFGKEFPYYEIKAHRIEIMEEYVAREGVEKKDGLDELLEHLKNNGYKIAVATASDMGRTKRFMTMTGVFNYFDEIVCGPDVPHGKPAPDIYEIAAGRLGLNPCECIALEDSPTGILSAYRAKCMPIMIPDLDEPDEETKKLLFAKFSSLRDVISLL